MGWATHELQKGARHTHEGLSVIYWMKMGMKLSLHGSYGLGCTHMLQKSV